MTGPVRTNGRHSLAREDGFTIVEVIVAALIVTITALAVLGAVDASSRNTFRAQQSQVVNDRLQSEMGKLKQLPYAQLALTSAPTSPSPPDPANPNSRVSGTQFNINGSGAANYESLVFNGGVSHDPNTTTVSGGTVDPGPTPFQSGDIKGNIYRYITWQQDASCSSCGNPWIKHVTVIATLNVSGTGGTRAYQELQSDVENPAANSNSGGPCAGCGTQATPWTFWLTDTPCNFNSRQQITGDHKTHNTRGLCSNGLQTGDNNNCGPTQTLLCPGAPDLMYTEAPPCLNDDCTTPQPLYDYATDVEPIQNPTNDRGLQMQPGPSCANVVAGTLGTTFGTLPTTPDTDSTIQQKIHKWVSQPIPSGYGPIVFNGTGELDLWTKTVNAAVQPGSICAYLFYRRQVGSSTIDTPVINLDTSNTSNITYFNYSQNPWPTTWTEVHIPIHFNLAVGQASPQLLTGDQLGVALNVDSGNTGAGGLEFLYDAPTFDSRLQVQVNPGIQLPFR
jgi:type II secretory pathway pseudopilin PulG